MDDSATKGDLGNNGSRGSVDGALKQRSKDDSVPLGDTVFLDNGQIEQRVQVHRRTLERMIQTPSTWQFESLPQNASTAEAFFFHVSKTTGAEVTWPTRLKIGAKTKKDPHVKILGSPDAVAQAKAKILELLEIKQNRIALKIDVAHTEHRHIIGYKGCKLQQVMHDTGCHVHFPDSNKSRQLPKSNQVSIAGPFAAIELARSRVRELAPLNLLIPLETFQDNHEKILRSPAVQEIMTTYRLDIGIKNDIPFDAFLVISGSVYQEHFVKTATESLLKLLFRKNIPHVTIILEVQCAQLPVIGGLDNCNLRAIFEQTGAKIRFVRGDDTSPRPNMSSAFYITGSPDSVLNARRHLIGCLPVTMQFDFNQPLPKNIKIEAIECELNVHITLKPKQRSSSNTENAAGCVAQTVSVRGYEYQMNAIYAARRWFIDDDELPAQCREYDCMENFQGMHKYGSVLKNYNCWSPVPGCHLQSPIKSPISPPLTPNFNVPKSPSLPLSPVRYSTPSTPSFLPDNDVPKSGSPMSISSSSSASPRDALDLCQQTLSPGFGGVGPFVLNVHNPSAYGERMDEFYKTSTAGTFAPQDENANHEWKAVGAERKLAEYSEKKVLAVKAMSEKPCGLPRIPDSRFAGYGFSRSMPQHMLSQLAETQNVTRHNKVLTQLLEDVDEDEDKIGPWRMDKVDLCPNVIRKDHISTNYFESLPVYTAALFDWTTDNVGVLLTKLNLSQFEENFRQEDVDLDVLLQMSENDLKDLNVNTFGARRKLIVAIQKINQAKLKGQTCVSLS